MKRPFISESSKEKKWFFSKASKTKKKAEYKNGIVFSRNSYWNGTTSYLWGFALNKLHKYSVMLNSWSVLILHFEPMFTLHFTLSVSPQCAVCIWSSILPLVCSLQSIVHNPVKSSLYTDLTIILKQWPLRRIHKLESSFRPHLNVQKNLEDTLRF